MRNAETTRHGMSMVKRLAAVATMLLLVMGVCCAQGPGGVTALEAHRKFLEVRKLYEEKIKGGYDLSEVEPLREQLPAARQARDWDRFMDLLNRIEAGLKTAKRYGSDDTTTPEQEAALASPFGFGLEYARPGVADKYAPIGATWIRIGPIIWDWIEPKPPQGGRHTYNWALLDRGVREYQGAGFRNVQFVLNARNKWASRKPSFAGEHVATPPRAEHWDTYRAFIAAMAERYDADGKDDMPGLRYPVNYFAVESEAQHAGFWQGTVQEYGQLLAAAGRAAKGANPDAKIMLSGFNLADLMDDDPQARAFAERVKRLPEHHRKSIAFIEQSLALDEHFDVISLHYNYDYKGLYGVMHWLRGQMKKNGYTKPVWAGDAAAAPMFDGLQNPRFTKAEADALYNKLLEPRRAGHREAAQMYERLQAATLVKKLTVSRALGLHGINIANLRDWVNYWGGRNWRFQGIRRPDGTPRPAYHAYRLYVQELGSASRCKRIETDDPNVWIFEMGDDSSTSYVAWCDQDTATASIATDAPRAISQSFYVQSDALRASPSTRALAVEDGKVQLDLTTMPVLVRPAGR